MLFCFRNKDNGKNYKKDGFVTDNTPSHTIHNPPRSDSVQVIDFVQWVSIFGITFDRYYELIAIILCSCILLLYGRRASLRFFFLLFFALVLFGIYNVMLIWNIPYPMGKFFQQYACVSIFILGYWYIFRAVGDLDGFMKKYIKVATFIAILGIFEFIVWTATGFDIFSGIYGDSIIQFSDALRIHSYIDEPGYMSQLLVPAIYISLSKKNAEQSKINISLFQISVILIAFFLTMATIAYFMFIIIILYIFIVNSSILHRLLLCCLFIFFITLFLSYYKNNDNLKMIVTKIEHTGGYLFSDDPSNFDHLNLSSFAICSNLYVARNAPSRILGTGLGTHEHNYASSDFYSKSWMFGYNSTDGYSLGIRLFSEFGIMGILCSLIFLCYFFNRHSVINVAAFFYLLSNIIRGGHYFRYGIIFFIMLFIFSSGSILCDRAKNLLNT